MSADPCDQERADDLLVQAAEALRGNQDPSSVQALAVACHGRMLAIIDANKHEAVRHALCGAALLAKLSEMQANPSEWLSIYEEQFCRYGCIWIHELIQSGDRDADLWVADALRLLARMEELHPEPVAWAQVLRDFFLNHQAETIALSRTSQQRSESKSAPTTPAAGITPLRDKTAAADRRIVVVGNCQCHPLMLSLRKVLPEAFIHFCPSVHLASSEDVKKLHQRLRSADLLITHRIQPGYRNGLGVDTRTLRTLLRPDAAIVVLPNFHYEGHHPFIAYAADPDGRLASVEAKSPLGSYHDFLVMAACDKGLSVEALLQAPSGAMLTHIKISHQISIQELRQREQDCDVSISDWIEQVHRRQPLMHTINHPNQLCLDQLLRRLISHIDSQLRLQTDLIDSHEHLGAVSIPIHPWVYKALDLDDWALSWGQRNGQPLPIEEQLLLSIEFYQEHSWIIKNNRINPKFVQAQQLLSESLEQRPRISVPARSPRRQPTQAALIIHYDDVEMLAWQLHSGALEPYDRIYIWDGPYHFCTQLGLNDHAVPALKETVTGQQLIADPRVVYRHGRWQDEASKRIEAYTAISEDLVVLHDTDEFFRLDPEAIRHFWESPYDIGSHRIQNLYAGGLLGSDDHHRSDSASTLPHRRFIFRRDKISPSEHLDYLWLVGVAQNPADPSRLFPQALGDTLHLTGCRSTQGQIGKMSFYKCLALSKQSPDPVLSRLHSLIEAQELSAHEALLLYL
ncbi:MAG: WcbI family polysaccharide biosynthesis putative acetyltransferase, partial [Cyanobacteriota bacterium]